MLDVVIYALAVVAAGLGGGIRVIKHLVAHGAGPDRLLTQQPFGCGFEHGLKRYADKRLIRHAAVTDYLRAVVLDGYPVEPGAYVRRLFAVFGRKHAGILRSRAPRGGEGGQAHVCLDLRQSEEIVLLQREAEEAEAAHEAHVALCGVFVVQDDIDELSHIVPELSGHIIRHRHGVHGGLDAVHAALVLDRGIVRVSYPIGRVHRNPPIDALNSTRRRKSRRAGIPPKLVWL